MWPVALAIVIVAILYFIDRHNCWKVLFKVLGTCALLALIGMTFIYIQGERAAARYECTSKVRAAYPGEYDNLDNETLFEKVIAKYPNCDLSKPTVDVSSTSIFGTEQQRVLVNPANPYKPNSPCWQWSNAHPEDRKPCNDSENKLNWNAFPKVQAVDCYDAKTGKKIPDSFEQFGGITTGCGPGMTAKPHDQRVELTK